jgi:cation diffusion facilitator family transporter
VSRSRMLHRVAKKHNSQALEADALHFSTDIWSSAVVILGLICVGLSDVLKNADFLHYADAIAALVVAGIVIQVSIKLGIKTVNALLDTAPAGLEEKVIAAVGEIPGARDCHNIRIRASGPQIFIDFHVVMDGKKTLNEAHRLADDIERAIQKFIPNADVTVHPEPR